MIEEQIQRAVFSNRAEKTFIDKLLAKEDAERVRELMKKERLKRAELLELLYMMLSIESKLWNLSEWERYILLKFFVWLREFIKVAELHYDYRETIKNKVYSSRLKDLLNNNERLIEHHAKFLIDLYFNIGRTSLSIKGMGLLEFLKNKFEVSYPQGTLATPDIKEGKSA